MPTIPDTYVAYKAVIDRLKTNNLVTTFVGINTLKNMVQIYRENAPDGATIPYIIVNLRSGNSPQRNQSMGARKLYSNFVIGIKVVTNSTHPTFHTTGSGQPTHIDVLAAIERLFQQSQITESTTTIGFSVGMALPPFNEQISGGDIITQEGYEIHASVYNQNTVSDPIPVAGYFDNF
jgi:hypothetical protein